MKFWHKCVEVEINFASDLRVFYGEFEFNSQTHLILSSLSDEVEKLCIAQINQLVAELGVLEKNLSTV